LPSFDITEAEIRQRCRALLDAALDEAARMHHNYIGTEHLFNAITKGEDSIVSRLLMQAGLDARMVRNEVRREVGQGDEEVQADPPLTPRAYRVLVAAAYYAEDYNGAQVGDAHLLLAMIQDGDGVAIRKLRALGVDLEMWVELLLAELERSSGLNADALPPLPESAPQHFDTSHPPTPGDRTQTPLLDRYGRDLVQLARDGKLTPAIGREAEIRSVARTLTRSKKNNPLLLGDAGVGKTAVIEGLAYNIAHGLAPAPLLGKRIVQIDIGTIVAGTSLRGQFEERLVGLVEETRLSPDVILFIDEIHTIVGAGDTIDSNLDAANILKPPLSRGEIACIGATTHEEYRKVILQDSALERRFRTIDINEPSPADTLLILQGAQARYAAHHAVEILPEALKAAVDLSGRYMINRRQPDKSLDLLDEACARLVIQSATGSAIDSAPRIVTPEVIADVLAEWTGIPVRELNADERRRFANIEADLRTVVIGQDHAVQVVSEAIKTHRAGLSDPGRPVGVFLFLGPSGVGKTELAKALAANLFGSEDALIRFDMSEFHDEHTVARLIGSPPGYKDSARGGQLTEALRRKPYAVILLDEVEKAAPEVFDIFLQVFDDGRLTDARGTTADARHAVWIMTSNVGTAESGKVLGFAGGGYRPPAYEQHLKRFFRIEFLNRLDEVVIFNPLHAEALESILDLQLAELRERLAVQGHSLLLGDDTRALIIRQGTDAVNGARPLRRAVERLLTRPLSNFLLEATPAPGSVIIARIGADGTRLHLEAQAPASAG